MDFGTISENVAINNLVSALQDTPGEVLGSLGVAAHQVIIIMFRLITTHAEQALIAEAADKTFLHKKLNVRLYNFPNTPLRNMKSNLIGALLSSFFFPITVFSSSLRALFSALPCFLLFCCSYLKCACVCIGKFVSIRGAVIRVSSIKPLVTQLTFACAKCGATQTCTLTDGRYVAPSKCDTPACRGKVFLPDRNSAVTLDWQKIRYIV